jgi:histone H3/H4
MTCQHVHLALRSDEELNAIFKKCVIREGGVLPSIQGKLLQPVVRDIPPYTDFEGVMFAKARDAAAASGAPFGVFVDPRTGLHMGAHIADKAAPTGEDTRFFPLPLLDAMSAESQQDRRRLAEAALSEEERAMMKAEGHRIRCYKEEKRIRNFCISEERFKQGWSRQSPARFHQRRLREVRWARRAGSYTVPPEMFTSLCRIVGQDYKTGLEFTAEAIECLQTLTEAYMVRLAEDSQLNAVYNKRVQVQEEDIEAAWHIRGERRGFREYISCLNEANSTVRYDVLSNLAKRS